MPSFRTEFSPKPSSNKLDHSTVLLSAGSCFAEHIAQNLKQHLFSIEINPFGVIYNPVSLFKNLSDLWSAKKITENDLICYNDLYLSLQHTTRFNHQNPATVVHKINQVTSAIQEHIKKTNCLILSFGTAWVYRYQNRLVANCHKIPQKEFQKEFLTINQIVEAFHDFKSLVDACKPNIQIILTVSPVRHLKDGVVENQKSKSLLHLATQEITSEYNNVEYFPAYEILLDDLRDYRFYKEDLIHPNNLAIQHIWNIFSQTYFIESTQILLKEINRIKKDLNHKPFNPESTEHKRFKEKTAEKIRVLKSKLPNHLGHMVEDQLNAF